MTRALGYIRVSSDMQLQGHSLEAQRRAITDACAARGYILSKIIADEALSARSDRIESRPGLSSILEAVKAHQVDVLLVHSLDRLARNVMTTLRVFNLLAENGVAFVSLSESIDYTSPEGRLQLTVLGAFAAYFSDNLARHVSKGKDERTHRGLQNNQLPRGYTHDDAGNVVIDATTAPAVLDMWRLAMEGKTMRQIGRSQGLPASTIKTQLENRFYVGEIRYLNVWRPGTHPALIDRTTFDQAWAQRVANRRVGSSPPGSHAYSLGGLLTCAVCGKHLAGNHAGRYYICLGRKSHNCTQRMVNDNSMVEQFSAILSALILPEAAITAALARRPAPRSVDVAALSRRLDRLSDLYEMGDVPRAEYVQRRDELRAQIAEAENIRDAVDLPVLAAQLRDLGAAWRDSDAATRQRIAAGIVRDLLVRDRHIVALRPHPAWAPLCDLAWECSERPEYYQVKG